MLNESRHLPLHVLFVCTGNICRSPTAERLAIAYASRVGVQKFEASSAGIRAVIAHSIHEQSALVLSQLGVDASNFAARQLTPRIASAADLILTMTTRHRESVLELNPRLMHRTYTLGEASSLASAFCPSTVRELAELRPMMPLHQCADVPDPIGQSPDVFAAVARQISDLLPPVLDLCQRSSAVNSSE